MLMSIIIFYVARNSHCDCRVHKKRIIDIRDSYKTPDCVLLQLVTDSYSRLMSSFLCLYSILVVAWVQLIVKKILIERLIATKIYNHNAALIITY